MYTRVTHEEYTVQGYYGRGWEDVATEDARHEARARLREYRENEPQYAHRLVTRRVRNVEERTA